MKRIHKGFVLGCFFLLVNLFIVHAQPVKGFAVSGRVVSAGSGEALPGAVITLVDLKRSVLTDQNGNYQIAQISVGHHVLEISYAGFATIVVHIELTNSIQKDISLKPNYKENQEVVVTGTTSPTFIRKTTTPISIFRQVDLQQSVSSNIVDALSRVPGVSQLTTGPAIAKPIIRGLGSNRVIVVNDGIRQEGQQWGDEHGLEIDEASVNRVEILKGPSSLLYGSDALAGVIHFQSAPPVEEGALKGKLVTGYQTNGGLYSTHFQVAGNRNGVNWSSYASIKSAGDYSNPVDGKVLNARFHELNSGGQIGIHKKWGYSNLLVSTFSQRLGIIEGERDRLTGRFLLFAGSPLERVATATDYIGRTAWVPNQQVQHFKLVSDNSIAIQKSRLKFSLGFQQNVRKEFGDPVHPTVSGIFFDLGTLNYNLHWQLPEKKEWHTTIGVNGMKQQNTNRGEERLIPDYHLFDAGLFLFTQRTENKISWSGGIRMDMRSLQGLVTAEDGQVKFNAFHRNFSNWSGSVGLSYEPISALVLKANLSRGFRAPSLSELASNGAHEGTNRYEVGNRDLASEISWQADVGLQTESEHVSIAVNAFRNLISHFIFYRKLVAQAGGDSLIHQGGEELTAFAFDQQGARLQGIEVTIDVHPHPIHWLHFENSFSLVRGKFDRAIDPAVPGSNQLPLLPAPRWNSEIRGDFEKGWGAIRQLYIKLVAQQTFAQDRFFTGFSTETRTPAYLLMDAGLGFSMVDRTKKTKATLHLAVTNLGDKAWQSHTSRLKYTPENMLTGQWGVFNKGRNFSIRLIVPLRWERD